MTALDILIPVDDTVVTFTKYYLPEARLESAGCEHFRAWHAEGWLTLTDGDVIDFEVIKADILTLSSLFQLDDLAYDPWQATQLAQELQKDGAKVVEYRMTVQNMSEPMKHLDVLIRTGQYRHDGNPISHWCMSNVVAKVDAKDNVYPRKAREENKIDGAVAKIMNIGRLILNPPPKPKEYKIIFS